MPRKRNRERKFFAWWVVPSRAAYRKWLKRVAGTKWDPCDVGASVREVTGETG